MEMETGVGVGGGVEAPPSSPVRPSGGEPGGAPTPAAVTGSAERKDTEDGGEPAAAGDQEEKEGGDGEMEEGDGEVTVVEPPAQPPLPDIPTNGAHVTKRGKGLLEFTVALEPPLLPLKPPAAAEPVDAEAEAEADARAAAIAEKLGKVKAYTEWVDDAKGCGWRVMYFPYGNPHKGVVRGPHTFKLGVYVELKPTSMEVGKEGGAGPAKEGKEGGGDEEEDEEAEDVPYCRRYVRVTCAARHRGEGPAAAAAMREVGGWVGGFRCCLDPSRFPRAIDRPIHQPIKPTRPLKPHHATPHPAPKPPKKRTGAEYGVLRVHKRVHGPGLGGVPARGGAAPGPALPPRREAADRRACLCGCVAVSSVYGCRWALSLVDVDAPPSSPPVVAPPRHGNHIHPHAPNLCYDTDR